jgi:hypothetical protein
MSYCLIPVQKDSCLFLTCEGDLSLAEITAAWREVHESLAETGWKRVLVNVTALQTSPDTGELFDLAKLFWWNFPPAGRIALVVQWGQCRFAKLLEMLVRTVGIYLTVFVSEEQAEAWVRGGSLDKDQSRFQTAPGNNNSVGKPQVNIIH